MADRHVLAIIVFAATWLIAGVACSDATPRAAKASTTTQEASAGYHCAESDTACEDVVQQLEDVVNQRIDEGDRVVIARDTDLPTG